MLDAWGSDFSALGAGLPGNEPGRKARPPRHQMRDEGVSVESAVKSSKGLACGR